MRPAGQRIFLVYQKSRHPCEIFMILDQNELDFGPKCTKTQGRPCENVPKISKMVGGGGVYFIYFKNKIKWNNKNYFIKKNKFYYYFSLKKKYICLFIFWSQAWGTLGEKNKNKLIYFYFIFYFLPSLFICFVVFCKLWCDNRMNWTSVDESSIHMLCFARWQQICTSLQSVLQICTSS